MSVQGEYRSVPYEFHMGQTDNAYRYLGAHPAKEGGYNFHVWAPMAYGVKICGDWNNWQGETMLKEASGVWDCYCPEAEAGQYYKFNILDGNGNWSMRSDPYAFASEVRPGTASILTDIEHFEFHDDVWMTKRDKNYNKPLNIYEMHLGSWKHAGRISSDETQTFELPQEMLDKEMDAENDWYTYEEIAEYLIPWLKDHHYTHVEFLPLSEHPFDGSWGYQTTGYFSVTSRYGTPAQFAKLVDLLHQAEIGVIIDFVPVHFAQNMDALSMFDGTALYEYDSDVGHSEWGTCNFNYYRGEVCSFLTSAAAIWLDVYHCDGIRMDAISRALYWQGDDNRGVNEGAVRFLQNMNQRLQTKFPTCMLIAEDSTNYLKVTAPVEYGGLGFDYKWDMGWMHDSLDFFATPFGERRDHYHKLTFGMAYFYNELYLLALSHDEVVHGKKTIIDKMWGTYEEKCAQVKQYYLFMFTRPGKKLNFMGNELAHFREWDEKKQMDWKLLKYPFHDAFQNYFASLGDLYTSHPALYEGEYNSSCFEWIACQSRDEGIYAWVRRHETEELLVVMNTQYYDQKAVPLYMKEMCAAEEIFCSDDQQWGGLQSKKQKAVTVKGGVYGRDYTLLLEVPKMSASVFQIKKIAEKPLANKKTVS